MQFSTQPIQVALQALKKAATKGKSKKSLLENIDNVSSSVVLLNSSAPSSIAFNKLASVLRTPLVPLYSSYSDSTLEFSATILKKIITDGLKPCLLETHKKKTDTQEGWELVANSLLSGVIDFLENEETERSKAAIAKAFYSPICDFFLKDDTENKSGANLRYTAYTLLSYTAVRHVPNQVKLRDPKLMGGRSLGMVISKTRDFAVLEVLFNLFVQILPSASASKKKHSSFIRDVFLDNFAECPDCGVKIVKLLENTTGKDWEETTTKLFDILSDADVSFPQPFNVDEVIVCDNTYPQPEVSDRFYIDKSAFFINVRQEDGMYESLQIRYETVEEIKIIPAKGRMTAITMKLKTSPKIGDQPLSTTSGTLNLEVEVHSDDVSRLSTALRHRKLVAANTGTRKVRHFKSSITESSARLDFEDGNGEELPLSSVKTIDVQKFYGSDQVGVSPGESVQAKLDTTHIEAKATKGVNLNIEDIVIRQVTPAHPSAGTHLTVSIFGRSDEELSEVEDVKILPLETKSNKRGGKSFDFSDKKPSEVIDLVDDDEVEKRVKLVSGSSSKKWIGVGAAVIKEDMVMQDENIIDGSPVKSANVAEPANGAHSQHLKPEITGGKETLSGQGNTEGRPDDPLTFATAGEVPNETQVTRPLREHQMADLSAQVSASHETRKLLPSSPSSKKSLMRAKNAPSEKNPVKSRARKRTSAYIVQSGNEDEPSKKKVRADHRNSDVQDEDYTCASSPCRKPSSHLLQRIEHLGTKGKRLHEWHKAAVNWEQVPKEATPDGLAFKDDHLSSILMPQLEDPVRSPAVETMVKKENNLGRNKRRVGGLNYWISTKIPNTSKSTIPASRPQYHTRAPLQIVVRDPNTAPKESETLDAPTSAVAIAGQSRRRRPTNTVGTLEPVQELKQKTDTRETEDKESTSTWRAYLKSPKVKKADLLAEIGSIDREHLTTVGSVLDRLGEAADMGIRVNPLSAPAVTFDNVDYVRRDKDRSNEITNDACVGQANPKMLAPKSKTYTVTSTLEVAGVPEEKPKMKTKPLGAASADLVEDTRESPRNKDLPVLHTKGVCDSSTTRQLLASTNEHHNVFSAGVNLVYKQPQLRPKQPKELEGRMNTRPSEGNSTYCVAEVQPRRKNEDKLNKESGMEEIAAVLNDIHNAIVSNMENKFRGVRSDIRIARDRLLHEAVADLREMREESITHFHNLFSLETEYANFSRKLGAGYEVATSVNNDICSFIRQTVNVHDRGSLSKNMPQSLFVSALPGSFLKFTG